MSTIKPLASLSAKGYIYSIVEKTDRLMAIFFASDTHQDYIYEGSISNLSIILQESGNDILQVRERLRSTLERFMGNHYDTVVVMVLDDTETNFSSRINITISITVTEEGERYDVANLLTLIDGKFEKITKLNNTGNINYL